MLPSHFGSSRRSRKTSRLKFCASTEAAIIGKSVLKIFAKFTGKQLYQSLFFNKVADLRPAV